MKFFLHEKAFQEYLAAANWYEEREDSLRNDFVFEIEHTIAAIISDPKRCAFAAKTYQIARVHRFPYSIFYEFDSLSSTVFIHAIFHQKRRPRSWMNRKFDVRDFQ